MPKPVVNQRADEERAATERVPHAGAHHLFGVGVPKTHYEHEDRRYSGLDESEEESIRQQSCVGSASWGAENDDGPADANGCAYVPGWETLGKVRDRVSPDYVAEVKDERHP